MIEILVVLTLEGIYVQIICSHTHETRSPENQVSYVAFLASLFGYHSFGVEEAFEVLGCMFVAEISTVLSINMLWKAKEWFVENRKRSIYQI